MVKLEVLKQRTNERVYMALVTFNENVDLHVKGDKVELTDAEIKRLETYADRYEIKNPFTVEGEKTSRKSSQTTTTTSAPDAKTPTVEGGAATAPAKNAGGNTVSTDAKTQPKQ